MAKISKSKEPRKRRFPIIPILCLNCGFEGKIQTIDPCPKCKQIPVRLEGDYINLGDICRKLLGQQCQYCCPYATGLKTPGVIGGDYENLGVGLRVLGTPADYHSMKIHKDDYKTFVKRYKKYMEERDRF